MASPRGMPATKDTVIEMSDVRLFRSMRGGEWQRRVSAHRREGALRTHSQSWRRRSREAAWVAKTEREDIYRSTLFACTQSIFFGSVRLGECAAQQTPTRMVHASHIVRPWWIPRAVWHHSRNLYIGELVAIAYAVGCVEMARVVIEYVDTLEESVRPVS